MMSWYRTPFKTLDTQREREATRQWGRGRRAHGFLMANRQPSAASRGRTATVGLSILARATTGNARRRDRLAEPDRARNRVPSAGAAYSRPPVAPSTVAIVDGVLVLCL